MCELANGCALWHLQYGGSHCTNVQSRMYAAMQHRNSNDGIPSGNLLHKQQFGMFIVSLLRYENALTCASVPMPPLFG